MPLGGRLPEALGEDPYLAGRLAVAEVRAIQDAHVISMVKHFIGNNAETGRTGSATSDGRTPAINTVVGERALRELYYPPFKAAVQRGRAGSVMGSYNRVNGVYACQNPRILRTLKEDWGWDGFVAPDFKHAVRDPVAAANAGLDIPGLEVTEGRTAEDLTSGRIPAERLDEIVRRTLFAIFDAGLDQHPVPNEDRRPALASTREHVALATRIATDGMVLLANRGRLLPLDSEWIGSLAVIGTARDDAQWVMAGSPCVRVSPDRRVTPLEGISARAGPGIRVAFAQGSFGDAPLPTVPTEALTPPGGKGTGLLGEYWNGEAPAGQPALTVVDPTVDIPRAPDGLTGAVWSARWTGTITPTEDGPHRFTVLAAGITRLEIDRHLVATGEREFGQVFDGPPLPLSGMVDLRAGQPVGVRLGYSSATAWPVLAPGVGGGNLQLGWQPPDTLIQEAATLAAGCDAAVVFAGVAVGEGMDRASLALPGDQDRLIAAVAAANPRTVVVLNTGGPVLMPWLDQVAAVVQAWLPGQQFGEAVAAVLFGDGDPGGRLPVTFPASPDQGPITGPERYLGVDGDARYDEGALVGYRWFDQHGQEPLFPFGHGLSYGEYAYGQPRVTLDEATGAVTVSLQVTNVGARPGAEVVQLYLAAPAAAQQPPRQLKGFAKLHLDPGATGEMSLRLERDDLATFDEASGEWVVHPGRYEVLVGRSSRDLRGRAGFEVGYGRRCPGSATARACRVCEGIGMTSGGDASQEPAAIELAVCAEMVFLELPVAERVRRIDELGFQVEIWDWTVKDVDALAATGARFSSMTGYIRGALADEDGAEELLRTAAQSVPVAERLGCPRLNLHGTGLDSNGLPARPAAEVTGAMWLTAARTLDRIADLGERAGVTFCLENLNTAVDHPGVPFARAADTLALVEAVGRPGLRMNLDLYHAQIGEGNLIELVRRAAPLIGELQVADVPGRCEPGTGEINYPAIAAALEELGYRGTVGLEAWASGDSEQALTRFRDAFTRSDTSEPRGAGQ